MSQVNPTQTVLITGATSGIGLEFANIFAENGYALVLVARTHDRLQLLKTNLLKRHTTPITLIAQDLAKPHAAASIVSTLEQQASQVDILINNAGFGSTGLFSTIENQETLDMLQVNIAAVTELCQLLLPDMITRKQGKILNISSTAAFQAVPNMAVYSATKAYVLSFTEALAHELKPFGISVTTLCPGLTKTPFIDRANMQNTRIVKKGWSNAMSPRVVAEIGYRALQQGKRVAVCGFLNHLLAFATRFTPRRLTTRLAGHLMAS